MAENYIVINGKKAELTPEQLKALGIEVKEPSPFDRVNRGDSYFFIPSYGVVNTHEDKNDSYDVYRFGVANYCTDKDLLQQQAYRETLNRLLWRFSMEHGGGNETWNPTTAKFHIIYNHDLERWGPDRSTAFQRIGIVYFESKDIAEQAIEEIVKPFMKEHPDFKL